MAKRASNAQGYFGMFVTRPVLDYTYIVTGLMKTHRRPPLVAGCDVSQLCSENCRQWSEICRAFSFGLTGRICWSSRCQVGMLATWPIRRCDAYWHAPVRLDVTQGTNGTNWRSGSRSCLRATKIWMNQQMLLLTPYSQVESFSYEIILIRNFIGDKAIASMIILILLSWITSLMRLLICSSTICMLLLSKSNNWTNETLATCGKITKLVRHHRQIFDVATATTLRFGNLKNNDLHKPLYLFTPPQGQELMTY